MNGTTGFAQHEAITLSYPHPIVIPNLLRAGSRAEGEESAPPRSEVHQDAFGMRRIAMTKSAVGRRLLASGSMRAVENCPDVEPERAEDAT